MGPSLARMGGVIRSFMIGAAAALLPHPGIRWQDDPHGRSAATLAWPWSYAFGPVTAFTVNRIECAEDLIEEFRSHRIVLEPGLVLSAPVELDLRSGYRFLWHAVDRSFGFGAGLGTTWQLLGVDSVRPSLSPELLAQHGACCSPGYLMLALRYDHFWAGESRNMLSANLGITFW